MRLFHKPGDYAAFERVLARGWNATPWKLLTYCVMPNHWHLGGAAQDGRGLGALGGLDRRDARPAPPRTLPSAAAEATCTKGRFKSFPVAEDEYFLTLCRYVEANPLCGRSWWSGLSSGNGAGCGGGRTAAAGRR